MVWYRAVAPCTQLGTRTCTEMEIDCRHVGRCSHTCRQSVPRVSQRRPRVSCCRVLLCLSHVLLAQFSHQTPSTRTLTYADARGSTRGHAHSCRTDREGKRACGAERTRGTERESTTAHTRSPLGTQHKDKAGEREERAPSARKHPHQVGTCQLALAHTRARLRQDADERACEKPRK